MMAQQISIHPENPQPRAVRKVVETINNGSVIAYPTDSSYALGCAIGQRDAIERIVKLRGLPKTHHFTLLCRDLTEIATFAIVTNPVFRLLKAYTPGAYTFILPATREVPRKLQNAKRKTIGIRVPDHPVTMAILEELGHPLMSVSLQLPGDELPFTSAYDINERLSSNIDLIVDGEATDFHRTSIIDLVGGYPVILREGKGDVTPFQ